LLILHSIVKDLETNGDPEDGWREHFLSLPRILDSFDFIIVENMIIRSINFCNGGINDRDYYHGMLLSSLGNL
jgi:hypothetical protein